MDSSGTPSPESTEKFFKSLSSAAAYVSAASRTIPAGRDFHFYNNFPEFKSPSSQIVSRSESVLRTLSSFSAPPHCRQAPPPLLSGESDLDDALEIVVSSNDNLLELFNAAMDEFKLAREKAESEAREGISPASEMESGGFQVVKYGKKKKRGMERDHEKEVEGFGQSSPKVKVAERDKKTEGKAKVPFHIPTIQRPQDRFHIIVNNANQPFEHVWLERSDNGSRFVHPLENLSISDFVDRSLKEGELPKPLHLESTPFQFVEEVKELKELAAKLQDVNEFAVDLEHNQYRSFQGLTCLMQISTRSEDFIIDTLKLRVQIGPYLRQVFKDPSKRKVMHGADRDILWLQRDFGIYVCNLFDTGQASRVLQLERNSLEYLLQHFCEVIANKEYQIADWRLRPLPDEMIKYAREDTHYLLYMYDLIKARLVEASTSENDLLLEVYRRSSEICLQLYEKELLTDTSYLYIYRLNEANFDSKQLAVVAGLCQWRDAIARAEDESTGYILPNKSLLEIARQMPVTATKLRGLVRSKHPFVERHLNTVISIIIGSIKNSSAFESVAEQLRMARIEAVHMQQQDDGEPSTKDHIASVTFQGDLHGCANANAMNTEAPSDHMEVTTALGQSTVTVCPLGQLTSVTQSSQEDTSVVRPLSSLPAAASTLNREYGGNGHPEPSIAPIKASIATVQMVKKPSGVFGALLGNKLRRNLNSSKIGGFTEPSKNKEKLEQIKSSVALPFHSFSGEQKQEEQILEEKMHLQPEAPNRHPSLIAHTSNVDDVIPLVSDTEKSASPTNCEKIDGNLEPRKCHPSLSPNIESSEVAADAPDEVMSFSDLSSSFQECYQSINEMRGVSSKPQMSTGDSEFNIEFKAFDYAAARREMNFDKVKEEGRNQGNDVITNSPHFGDLRKGFALDRPNGGEKAREFSQPRRRQAFPASGNRTTTYH